MQVTLPDDARLEQRAQAAGFATVEDYLLQLVARDAEQEPSHGSQSRLSSAEWVRRFREFIATMKPRHAHLDDSRDSIYPIR